MAFNSISFDDEDGEDLSTFSGLDLLIAHYDQVDLDWQEVAERSVIDERRGLVIAQTAVLEVLVDEFILYLLDSPDEVAAYAALDGLTLGRRISQFEAALEAHGLVTPEARAVVRDLRAVASRRNQLAHGTIERRMTRVVPIAELSHADLEVEWVLLDRRGDQERLSMAGLREDVYMAAGAFSALLAYAEWFVEIAPRPQFFSGGRYLPNPEEAVGPSW